MAHVLRPGPPFTDELLDQQHHVGRLVKSSNDGVPNNEDRDPQLAVFMDKRPPQVGLRNCCEVPTPFHHLTADLDIQRAETPGDLDRFCSTDGTAFDVVIGVGDPMLREKLSRALAGRSPGAIVQYDVCHDSLHGQRLCRGRRWSRSRAGFLTMRAAIGYHDRFTSDRSTPSTAHPWTSVGTAKPTRPYPQGWQGGSVPRSSGPWRTYTHRN